MALCDSEKQHTYQWKDDPLFSWLVFYLEGSLSNILGLFSLGACDNCDNCEPCDNGVTEVFEFLEETDKQKQILYYTQNLDFEKVNINIYVLYALSIE